MAKPRDVPWTLLLLDTFFRRIVVPLGLATAVLFRYSVVSFLYLILLLIFFVLPSTRNSAHSGFYLLCSSIAVLLSAVVAVSQILFQLILVTDYGKEFTPCNSTESTWRHLGFILYSGTDDYPNPHFEDVVRYLTIDVGVFVIALLSLVISSLSVHCMRKQPKHPSTDTYVDPKNGTELKEEAQDGDEVVRHHTSATASSTTPSMRHSQFQPFIQVPNSILYSIEILYFVLLALCASVVPSVTAFLYLVALLIFLLLWALHLPASRLKFGMRIVTMVYSAFHLVILYVFQFSEVQKSAGISMLSPGEVKVPLSLRLTGMTPVVFTNCSQPTALLLYQGTIYSYFLNPGFLLLLFYLAALDFRLRAFKPRVSRSTKRVVFFPSYTPFYWVSYSNPPRTQTTPTLEAARGGPSSIPLLHYPRDGLPTQGEEAVSESSSAKKKTQRKFLHRVIELGSQLVYNSSFGVALVAMMAWSIVFPSWLTLILLLWACIIWIFPFVYPNAAILFTAPFLVPYSCCLLVLHYMTFLSLNSSERNNTGLMILQENQVVPTANTEEKERYFPYVFMQCAFTAAFFLALYTFMRNVKMWRAKKLTRQERTERPPLTRQDTVVTTMLVAMQFKNTLLYYVSFYWVVVTMAAFLLAALVGDPSLFKIIFMFGFVLSVLIYQIFRKHWYRICWPIWWAYIVYSFLELTVIYIYQFRPVATGILSSMTNITGSEEQATYWLASIGFPPVAVGDSYSVAELIRILLPPTVFIAVMAMQLRYFYPRSLEKNDSTSIKNVEGAAKTLFRSATLSVSDPENSHLGDGGSYGDDRTKPGSVNTPEITPTPTDDEKDGHDGKSAEKGKIAKLKKWIVDIFEFLWDLVRKIVIFINQIFWRFLNIHLHKIIALVIFSIIIDKPGASMLVFLALVLLSMPLRQLNVFFYPVFTLLVGVIVICEMVYQFPVLERDSIDLANNRCLAWDTKSQLNYSSTLNGSTMTYTYSTKLNDAAWFGLYKASNFAAFSAGHIAAILLLALWFTVKRRMKRQNENLGQDDKTSLLQDTKGSLFPGISREEAEKNIWTALKYLVNHVFDYYGVQICCALVAIVMTSRDDVYSILYGFILGAVLLVTVAPESVVAVIWPMLTYLVGVLIVIQYVFLLGAPNGACLRPNSTLCYPWISPSDPNEGLTEQWRRYLFLSDYVDILDKYYLYADFILFLVMALKTFRIFKAAQTSLALPSDEDTDGDSVRLWNTRRFFNTCRDLVFGNWFWVSIFLLFLAGALRVSLFGYVYLLMCFIMGWWGREMLASDVKKLRISWEIVRVITWFVMLLRAFLQILGCVYFYPVDEPKCIAVLLLDGDCSRPDYYNKSVTASDASCDQYATHTSTVGMGVEAALFVVLTLQILILDSQAFHRLQIKYRKTLLKGKNGAVIFDRLVKERLVRKIEKEQTELEEINTRLSLLQLQQGKLVAHKMHAGVRIPKDIKVLKSSRRTSASTSGSTTPHLDQPPPHLWSMVAESAVDPQATVDKDTGGIFHMVKVYVKGFYTLILEWLEEQSRIYREVQKELNDLKTPRSSASPPTTITGTGSPVEGEYNVEEDGKERGRSRDGDDYDDKEASDGKRDDDGDGKRDDDGDGDGDKDGDGKRDDDGDGDRDGDGKRDDDGDGDRDGDGKRDGDGDADGKRDDDGGKDRDHRVSFQGEEGAVESTSSEEIVEESVSRRLMRVPALESAGDADIEPAATRRVYHRTNSVEAVLDKAETFGSKLFRLLQAIAYFLLANTAHVCYFFMILSIINNGSVLSLVYAVLLFFWGLLTVPSPTKRFWLVMIFYTMTVLLVKYGFQFREIQNVPEPFSGLPVLQVIGVDFSEDNFLYNAIWDILLLLSLVIHRAILKESGLWRSTSLQIAVISDFHKDVNTGSRSERRLSGRSDSHSPAGSDDENSLPDPVIKSYAVMEVKEDGEENIEDLEEMVVEGSISVWLKIKALIRSIFGGLFKFYKKAANPNITFGARDFYVILVLLDAICFFIIVIGFSSFGLGQGDATRVASFIQENNVPLPFIIVLLLQFLSMVFDRAIYLKKSVVGKLIFNLLLIVGWHAYLFFILPGITGIPFIQNHFAQAVYFFKAWYIIVSSLQVISGYPYRVLGYFWGKKTDIISGSVLIVYRLIPIIPFLRVVMDWSLSSTSLRLNQYITVEEIWAQLFQKSVFRKWERDSPRDLGAPPSTVIKVLMGGGLILLSIALLWGPLIVISAIQQGSQPNPPVSFRASLTISGFPPLFTMDAQSQSIKQFSPEEFSQIRQKYIDQGATDVSNQFLQGFYRDSQFTRILMQGDGDFLWTISPPARQLLITSLNETSPPILEFQWRVGRQPNSGLIATNVEGKNTLNLSDPIDMPIRSSLIEILNSNNANNLSVTIPKLFPRIIHAPATGISTSDRFLNVLDPFFVDCSLSHNGNMSDGEWWSLSQTTGHLFDYTPEDKNALEFIVFSETVARAEFDFIVGQGIIGLYVAVVLVAANFLRGWMNDLFYKLTFEEIPNPDYLLDLCQSLFIARENGELVLEEILAGHLVYIFRSNAKFLEWTKPKND